MAFVYLPHMSYHLAFLSLQAYRLVNKSATSGESTQRNGCRHPYSSTPERPLWMGKPCPDMSFGNNQNSILDK